MSKILLYSLLLALTTLTFQASAVAQDDPDPDSPVPVLTSAGFDSTRSLARGPSGARLTINLTNVELREDEGANAFRVYLYQKTGRVYELAVDSLTRVSKTNYALRARFLDRSGVRGQPAPDVASLILVSWRGLASNSLRLKLGNISDSSAIPQFPVVQASKAAPENNLAGYRWSGDRVRFLEQATFGPSTELDNRIRRIGLRVWLAEQFEAPYPTIPYPEIPQMPTTPPSTCDQNSNPSCFRERYSMSPVQQWFFKESFYGNAQLRHRIAWALSQIWVTSGATIQQSSHMIAYHKVLSQNAFGNYRTLMKEMTLNAAMGRYLDMATSTKANPNENYPREILQLFTIGLYSLNPDGTIRTDSGGAPIPSYDQEIINNFSKVMTGWTFCSTAECPNSSPGVVNYKDPMTMRPANHDTTAKTLLQYPNAVSPTIEACQSCTTDAETTAYANSSLDAALDNIFHHPNVPPFISRLLIQQLVTSDPSPAYVARVASVFENNGQNVRGDLKAVVKAILLDPEARGNAKTAPRYGKLREPVQIVTTLGRLFPARSWDGLSITDGGLSSTMVKLNQLPFMSPTVFNYFSPDFVVPGTTLNAPEFQILNTASAIDRTNFMNTLIFEGVAPNATDSLRGFSLDLTEAVAAADADSSGSQLLDFLNQKMMHGTIMPEHRAAILTAVTAVPATNSALRAKTAIYLLAVSSHYQIQR